MVMQYRSLFPEIIRSEAGRKPSHSSSIAGGLPAAERLAAKAKLQPGSQACRELPRSRRCDRLLGRCSKNSLNSQSVCRHPNSHSQFLSFSRSTLEHKETGLNIKHNAWGDLPSTSRIDKC
ncbi:MULTISPECIES: hypothetical protein [unclassified Microcoleus]|uniref:hypothetical protein n=2 Tax=Microcoleus TaxID=44471 RepID=UPI002FD6D002